MGKGVAGLLGAAVMIVGIPAAGALALDVGAAPNARSHADLLAPVATATMVLQTPDARAAGGQPGVELAHARYHDHRHQYHRHRYNFRRHRHYHRHHHRFRDWWRGY